MLIRSHFSPIVTGAQEKWKSRGQVSWRQGPSSSETGPNVCFFPVTL